MRRLRPRRWPRAALLCMAAWLPWSAVAGIDRPAPAGELQVRATSPTAMLRGAASDALRLIVWYPAEASATERPVRIGSAPEPVFEAGRVAADAPWAPGPPRPLVMLSHGFGGSARQMTWLGTALARHGYVAAALDHPGSNGLEPMTPEGVYAPWERAADIRHAIDGLLGHPRLAGRIDARRIGVAGFSLGGWTAMLLAGARPDFDRFRAFCAGPRRDAICEPQREYPLDFSRQPPSLASPGLRPLASGATASQRDARVRAALLIAPALGQAIAPDSAAGIEIPVLVIAGDRDRVTPTPTNSEEIARRTRGSRLVLLPRVGHYDFLSLCTERGRRLAVDHCTDAPGTDRARTHRRAAQLAIDFFGQALAPDAAGSGRSP